MGGPGAAAAATDDDNDEDNDQVLGAAVTTDTGEVPAWLSGTLVRHACGVLGETDNPSTQFLNRVTHLFDCIEMGQSYHFHEVEQRTSFTDIKVKSFPTTRVRSPSAVSFMIPTGWTSGCPMTRT